MNPLVRTIPLLFLFACGGLKTTESDTGTVGVSPVEVLGILITPDEVIVPVGSSVQLQAMGLSESRESVDLTAAVRWESGSSSIAQVSNSLSSEGILEGVAPGSTTVHAEFDGVYSSPARITITDASLTRLAITPAEVQIGVGEAVQLTAEATFSDGSSSAASSQVRWITGDGTIATLDGAGLLTGEGVGETSVSIEWDGIESDPISVEVGSGSGGGSVDLVVASISAYVEGTTLTVTVGVENTGESSASGFWVDFFVNPPGEPTYGDWPSGFEEVSYVGPDETVYVSYQQEVTEASNVVAVLLDSLAWIEETNEDNNLGATETSAGTSPDPDGEPNLRMAYFEAWLYTDSTEYWVDVHNAGSGDAESFYVDVFHDTDTEPELSSTGSGYQLVDELPAGETTYLVINVDETCFGCTSWVFVDSFNFVIESDETDNTGYCIVEEYDEEDDEW